MLLLSSLLVEQIQEAPEEMKIFHTILQHYDDEEDDALAEGITLAFKEWIPLVLKSRFEDK